MRNGDIYFWIRTILMLILGIIILSMILPVSCNGQTDNAKILHKPDDDSTYFQNPNYGLKLKFVKASKFYNMDGTELSTGGSTDTTALRNDIEALKDTVGLFRDSINILLTFKQAAEDSIAALREDIGSGGGGTPYDSAGVAGTAYSLTPHIGYFHHVWSKLYSMKMYRDSVRDGLSPTTPIVLRIAKWGDSMAGAIDASFENYLQQAYGVGYANADNTCDDGASNSASPDYNISFNGSYSLCPAGGYVENGTGNGNILYVFYVREPGAGTFKVQTQFRSEAYQDEAGYTDIDADSTSIGLGVIRIEKDTADIWHFKVVGLTDTVRFLQFYATTNKFCCVDLLNFGGAGFALTDEIVTDSSCYRNWIQAYDLDLITLHYKDPIEGWAAALDSNFLRTQRAIPNAEWCYMGTTPSYNADSTVQLSNSILRAHALKYNQYFFDCYDALVNYANLVKLGWQGDGTHVTTAANEYCGNLMYRDMKIWDNIYEVSTKEIRVNYITALKGIDIGATSTSNLSWIRPSGLALVFTTGRDFLYKNFSDDTTLGHDANGLFVNAPTPALRFGLATPAPYIINAAADAIMISRDAAGNNRGDAYMRGLINPTSYTDDYRVGFTAATLVVSDTVTWDIGSVGAGVDSSRTKALTGAIAGKPVYIGFSSAKETGIDFSGECLTDNQIVFHAYNKTGSPIDLASRRYTFSVVNK